MKNSLKLKIVKKKNCFIFGLDESSDRPDPLHFTVYNPIACAENLVRIEQIYLDSQTHLYLGDIGL